MEGFMIRGWQLSFPGAAVPLRYSVGHLSRRAGSMSPANYKSVSKISVSTHRGAVSTRGISVFVPGLLEL